MSEKLIISDVHIGHPLSDKEAFFELIKNPWDEIILLGDIFDSYEEDYDIAEYNYISNRCTLVRGNHDWNTHAPEKAIVRFDGLNGLCMHGHQYFLWWRFYHPFGKYLHGFFKSKLDYQRWYEKVTRGHVSRQLLSIEERWALYKCKYPILLMGHTHVPKIIQTPTLTYVNPGAWRESKTFVVYKNKNFRLYTAGE